MILPELVTKIRRLFFVEHWKVGTIAAQLGLHPDTVRSAIGKERFSRVLLVRKNIIHPYMDFINQTLNQYPALRSTRLYEMLHDRGYRGSVIQLRRVVADIRPRKQEAFLRLASLPGEQAQADWAHFGCISIGKAKRHLSCFVMTLSYSRALWIEFFYEQRLENLLLAHVHAFADWSGVPRTILYDNMRSVVIERLGDAIHFHPRILELAGHYHFAALPCRPARGNEKGKVERVIHYIRHSFFAARSFSSFSDLNQQVLFWRDQIAHQRRWPDDDSRVIQDVFEEEKSRLLPLPAHRFETDLIVPVRSGKTIYIRFDLNDYSIPPSAVGKQLTLVASPQTIRILDGSTEIARHLRSYDRGKNICDPNHIDALLKQKRKAIGSTAVVRLQQSLPNIGEFLQAAFQKGESVARISKQLLLLIQDYGAPQVSAAINEALQQQTPRVSSVAFILARGHRNKKLNIKPVDLSRHPEFEDVSVPTHSLEAYDDLNKDDK